MRISIHQPMYIPWLGYFHKWANSDLFVILDDVEYSKNDFFNRNRIKTDSFWIWLTVPVLYRGNSRQPINQILIDQTQNWRKKHMKTIRASYGKAGHFQDFVIALEGHYSREYPDLISANMAFLELLREGLGVKTPFVLSSTLGIGTRSTQRLVDICRAVGADEYLSGQGAKAYLDERKFRECRVRLTFQEFRHPVYSQAGGEFIPNLSALDLLLNEGRENAARLFRGA